MKEYVKKQVELGTSESLQEIDREIIRCEDLIQYYNQEIAKHIKYISYKRNINGLIYECGFLEELEKAREEISKNITSILCLQV